MNHKERILAAIRHQPVDRIPTDIWATPEVWERLKRHFQVEDIIAVYDALDIDGIPGLPVDYTGPKIWKDTDVLTFAPWGMGYRHQQYGSFVFLKSQVCLWLPPDPTSR